MNTLLRNNLRLLLVFVTLLTIGCASGGGGGGSESSSSTSQAVSSNSGSSSSSTASTLFTPSFNVQYCGTKDPDRGTHNNLATLFFQFQNSLTFLEREVEASVVRKEVSIPVHFHVISKGDSFDDGEVPDSMIIEQMNVLNQAYSGATGGVSTPFRFHLAGINRVRNERWHLMSPGSETELEAKQELVQGGPETLNIYTVTIDNMGQEGEILGYSSLPVFYPIIPSFDGIVMNFRTLPGAPFERYNIGHVLVHEVGHWLGLLHTFQGECDGIVDDLVDDTPREKIPGRGEFCPVNRDSCEEREGMDPVHNHMTYTEDGCRFEFTPGQLSFMRFNAVIFRGMDA